MILLLFGPPGCGKGTQAAFLAERFHIPAISTGEMFRAECKAGTKLGKSACSTLSRGGLVPDETVNEIVANRISRADCERGFLLDGYPRTLPQAKRFSALLEQRGLPQPMVIHLDVPDGELLLRLTARRQCPKCLHIYNVLSQPPQRPGECDEDGSELVHREDDREEVILRRLRAYEELTGPVLTWFGSEMVRRVDGGMAAPDVWRAVERVAAEAFRDSPVTR